MWQPGMLSRPAVAQSLVDGLRVRDSGVRVRLAWWRHNGASYVRRVCVVSPRDNMPHQLGILCLYQVEAIHQESHRAWWSALGAAGSLACGHRIAVSETDPVKDQCQGVTTMALDETLRRT